jgi:hypothetical protein
LANRREHERTAASAAGSAERRRMGETSERCDEINAAREQAASMAESSGGAESQAASDRRPYWRRVGYCVRYWALRFC